MQFKAKVIWHQPHEQDGKVIMWQTRLYGEQNGHGVSLEVATPEEVFDKTQTYSVTISAVGESVPELRNPVGVPLETKPTLKKSAKKVAAKKR